MAKKVGGVVYKRIFENVFVCLRCKHKMKANPQKARAGKIHCRNCGYSKFRLKSKQGKR
jgi:ribosomal protein L40E